MFRRRRVQAAPRFSGRIGERALSQIRDENLQIFGADATFPHLRALRYALWRRAHEPSSRVLPSDGPNFAVVDARVLAFRPATAAARIRSAIGAAVGGDRCREIADGLGSLARDALAPRCCGSAGGGEAALCACVVAYLVDDVNPRLPRGVTASYVAHGAFAGVAFDVAPPPADAGKTAWTGVSPSYAFHPRPLADAEIAALQAINAAARGDVADASVLRGALAAAAASLGGGDGARAGREPPPRA